ncbi:hypothetical protein ABPG72_021051 [Tetrahymena utriculariae]
MQTKLFLIFLLISVLVNGQGFIKSNYTEIDSILNEATYYSIDKSCGNSEKERVEKRLNEIREQFQQTKSALQNIEVLQSTENYSIFVDNTRKQVYLAIRGTVPSKGSDLVNDLQMVLNQTPQRVQQINDLMKGQMTDLFNQGFSINMSGHSLGGSLALFACADNSWVNHCEVHNPYLDDTIINKLNPIFNEKGMNNKVIIQETLNDFVSQHFPQMKLNVTYSIFNMVQNVQGLNSHSSLTLFAKSFLEGQTIDFNLPSYSVQEYLNFVNICKDKFEQFINIISSCKDNQYYSFSSLSCIICPISQACRNNFLGPYNCPPSKISNTSGYCESCPTGTYTSEVGKNTCLSCPVANKCEQGFKVLCPPGTYGDFFVKNTCFDCNLGSYQLESGQTSCKSCPQGNKCPTTTEPPIPCPPGTYRDVFSDRTKCFDCNLGSYQLESGQTGCKSCPQGNKCPSTTEAPIPCPPGTYRDVFSDRTKCFDCNLGSYQLENGQTGCKSCPQGNKCPSTTEAPIPCPSGTYRDQFSDSTKCVDCNLGTYQVQSRSTSCISCPKGHMCPSTNQEPVGCPEGYYAQNTNQTTCQQCEQGYKSNLDKTGCQKINSQFLKLKNNSSFEAYEQNLK